LRSEYSRRAVDNFDSRNLSTGISLGYKINKNLSVGVTGKYVFEKIYVDEAAGLAFDFGTNFSKDNYSFAVVLSNLGSVDELKNQSSKLPTSVRIGGSYRLSKDKFNFILGLDGFKVLDGKLSYKCRRRSGYKDFVFETWLSD
jgi:hypothetical protein